MEKSKGTTIEKVRKYIPDDIAFRILSKLPIKSLKRFGCVRKCWAFLFENPYFMSIFRNNFISNHESYYDDASLLLHRSFYDGYLLSGEMLENKVKLDWPNPFQHENPRFSIFDAGSITGILCLFQLHENVVLWNPATKEFKIIPPSPLESIPPCYETFVNLVGFGYDHVRDDYKLMRTIRYSLEEFDCICRWDLKTGCFFFEIYSLRSNTWRQLDHDVNYYVRHIFGDTMYIDGMCHWLGLCLTDNIYIDTYCLTSFDLSNEMFLTTPIPSATTLIPSTTTWDDQFCALRLISLNGSISLISWHSDTFYISYLGELGVEESWTILFIIGPLPCVKSPIGVGKMGGIFFIKEDDEIVWFNLNTQLIEEIGVKGVFSANDVSNVLIYKENLHSFERINH